jgi:hypothetical protein
MSLGSLTFIMRFLQTTGNNALDREIEDLRRLASRTPPVASAAAASPTPVLTIQSQVIVQSADGTFVNQVSGLMFNTAHGFTLTSSGDFALVDLALTPGAGISISGATIGNTGVLTVNGSSGAVTTTNDVSLVTVDPGSPRAGQIWYRTDLNMLSIWNGSVVKRSSIFT